MKTWKKEEINFLEQNYKILDYDSISKRLNRSIGSIYWKCSNLGLKKGRWTEENKLDKEKVAKLLIEHSKKLNKSPSIKDTPIFLKSACQRHFGNFNNAKRYAGLSVKEHCTKLKEHCYEETEELAYIVGSLIGDGSFRLQKSNERSSYVIVFSTKDKDFMDFFIYNFNKWCGYDPKVRIVKGGYKRFFNNKYYHYKDAYLVQISFKEAWIFLKEFKDHPSFSLEFFSDKNLRWLIKGLWDAEGCIRLEKGKYLRIHFSNSNKGVVNLYTELLKKFGFIFSIHKKANCFNVNILHEYEMLRFINLINGITIKRKEKKVILDKLENKSFRERENFTLAIYRIVKQIPRGKVSTYSDIARTLNSKAYRAVGNALNKNKRPVLIPCHRVVKSNGEIGGYSRGRKEKIRLLREEGVEVKDNKIDLKKYFYRF